MTPRFVSGEIIRYVTANNRLTIGRILVAPDPNKKYQYYVMEIYKMYPDGPDDVQYLWLDPNFMSERIASVKAVEAGTSLGFDYDLVKLLYL